MKTSYLAQTAALTAARLIEQPKPAAEPAPVVVAEPVVAPAPAPEPVVAQVEAVPVKDVVFKNILFAFSSNVMTREGRETLDAYWPDLIGRRVELVGYTDNVGERAINDELALYRAMTVRNYLIRKGLYESHIKIRGRGLCCYIASNKSDETRGLNRRVEIHLIGN